LRKECEVRLVALRNEHISHLAWFVPYAYLVSLFEVLFRRVDVIYFSDGVICCLATFLRPFTRARFVVSVYGLEITYSHPVFSRLMRWGISHCARVAVISQNTWRIAVDVGVQEDRLRLIYLGVRTQSLSEARHLELRERFEAAYGVQFGSGRVLLNYGRQVKRKGLADFLEKGVPLLDGDVRLVVGIGSGGGEVPRLRALHRDLDLEGQVILLEQTDGETLAMLRRECALFVMPNIQVPNDVEGYGITPLECMLSGLPVVAFAVDALVESVREGGYLIAEGDYGAFVARVHDYLSLPDGGKRQVCEAAEAYVKREYTWEKTGREYLAVFGGKVQRRGRTAEPDG